MIFKDEELSGEELIKDLKMEENNILTFTIAVDLYPGFQFKQRGSQLEYLIMQPIISKQESILVAEHIVGMANSDGGYIVLGVDPDTSTVKGISEIYDIEA